ncbi:NUDIX domain-containing protein [Halanaeroarchaeum sulfurireducens]|nr:NUDIX hydrolase [Halanaeroarchaeum sulfurireducens]
MPAVRALATDAVILVEGEVVLLERDHPPHEGAWVLPGGLVERDETAQEACEREVREEVGMNVAAETFVGLFDDPDRDERGNVSAAYRCRPIGDATPTPREEAAQVDLFDPDELPRLGFDHEQIVAGAVKTNSQT